jgi:putative FmdB family regulatory protein
MPTYTYLCEDCSCKFELFFHIKDYKSNPKCSECESKNTIRAYMDDVVSQNVSVKKSDSELTTIGDLANRNRDKLSDDEKRHLHKKHNEYKELKKDAPLPDGMSRLEKGNGVEWPM